MRLRRFVLKALVGALLLALWGCSSSAPSGEPVDDAGPDSPSKLDSSSADDGGSPDVSTTDDAPPTDGSISDASPDGGAPDDAPSRDDATLPDAATDGGPPASDSLREDAASVDVSAEKSAAPDASLADSTVADAALAEASSDDDAAADASPPSEASSADAAPDVPPFDGAEDTAQLPDDAGAPDDAAVAADTTEASTALEAGASTVVPTLDGGDYVFTSGALSFEVDPQVGGRVVSFALDGQNVLTGPAANAINYGSTFWTSPQSDWGWPPLPEIDSLPYAASVDGGTLTLQGTENAALGVTITKAFSLDAASGSVTIGYTIENAGASARSFAPWEVTRVHPTGLMFFPTGQQAFSADSGPALVTQQASGATWFDADTASVTADTKFFADAARGWLAQESAGLVFVKKFAGAAPGSEAPGEAEIEMFVSGDGAYVELEAQGVYEPIAPGASRSWSVTWWLARVPASVDAGVGSASLVAFVDGL